MRFFIVFYLAIQCGWASYYSSSNTSGGMSLNIQRIDVRIEKFISTLKEMKRKEQESGTESQIDEDWYKRDESGEIIKGKNFQNHVLKILMNELIERFAKSEANRAEMIESILLYLNEFIGERFTPGAYQPAIKKIFTYAHELQQKPSMQVANTVFKELSETAQKAFRDDGVRVQTNGLERAPTGRNLDSMSADPMLVEVLFMQIVWDAQKRSGTRQELLNTIEKNMVKMEQLFGNDPTYTIVGTFSSLRSTLVEEAQKESPLPALIKYMISLITDTNIKKELEEENKEILEDKTRDEWKEITKEKARAAVSIWQKKDIPPQISEKEKRKQLKKEEKKKKKLAEKEGLENLRDATIDSVKNKGIETVKNKFSRLMGDVFGSLSKLGV